MVIESHFCYRFDNLFNFKVLHLPRQIKLYGKLFQVTVYLSFTCFWDRISPFFWEPLEMEFSTFGFQVWTYNIYMRDKSFEALNASITKNNYLLWKMSINLYLLSHPLMMVYHQFNCWKKKLKKNTFKSHYRRINEKINVAHSLWLTFLLVVIKSKNHIIFTNTVIGI